MNKTETNKSWFTKLVEKEVEYADPYEDRGLSIGIVAVGVLIGAYCIAHQTRSTGFFTATFGTLEMILLYGTLLYWIVTSALIIVGQKNLSRDLDLGGLFLPLSPLPGCWWSFPLILLILQTYCLIPSDFWCNGFPTTSPGG